MNSRSSVFNKVCGAMRKSTAFQSTNSLTDWIQRAIQRLQALWDNRNGRERVGEICYGQHTKCETCWSINKVDFETRKVHTPGSMNATERMRASISFSLSSWPSDSVKIVWGL